MESHWLMNFILSLVVSSSYVVSIHSFKPPSLKGKDRDDVEVIKHRFTNVSILCIFWILIVPIIRGGDFWGNNKELWSTLIPVSSWRSIYDMFYCVSLMSILYIGPIFHYLISDPNIVQDFRDNFTNKWGFRDHVFAPITEEIIYRAIIYFLLSDFNPKSIIRYGPLLFGIAHIHHACELITVKKLNTIAVLINTTFQTIYTSLFGMLAFTIFIHTQNVWCAIIIHSYCNVMGFPSIITATPAIKFAYYSLLILGLLGFFYLLP